MKKILTILFLAGMYSLLWAGTTGKIAGVVKDKSNGEPLPGVNIVLKGTLMGAATDVNGQYFVVNIPVGTYTVEISMVGYRKEIVRNVRVSADLTTKIDASLAPQTMELGEKIEVVAQRPQVQKDLTATMTVVDASHVETLPVTSFKQVIGLQTGTVVVPIRLEQAGPYGQFNTTPDDGIHFRGGRTNETAYLLNGIRINDPIWGGFLLDDLPLMGFNEVVTYTGTYLAEYGGGMSAVMNLVSEPKQGPMKLRYSTYTDHLGALNTENWNTYNNEFEYKGFIPGTHSRLSASLSGRYYTTDGRFYGYIYPDYRDSEGADKSGTPKKVPMNYDDAYSAIGSLNLRVTNKINITAGGLFNDKHTSLYSHEFKYNPYGAPRVKMNYWLGYAQWKHVLSKSYFYNVSVSHYYRRFHTAIFDDLQNGLVEQHILSPDLFSVSGIDYVWFNTVSKTDEIKFDLLGQVTPVHQLKFGINFIKNDLNYERRNPTAQDADTTHLRMKAWEAYNRKPYSIHAYVQDKMEFHTIGMIMNAGLRYDRVYPETYYMTDILRPTDSEMKKTGYKEWFSPRLGVSYPISQKMAFRFAYGLYYQFPHYYLVYQGTNDEEKVYPNYSLGEVTQIGNGNINPEKTTSYEAGLQAALSPQVSMNLTAFYRDMSDLTGLKTIYGPRTYQLFTNDSYGIARGIEMALTAHISSHFNVFVNYTYSRVNASKQSSWYVPLFPQNRTFTADWDIPHNLTFDFEYMHSSKIGVSIIGNLSSGYPYSPSAINPNSERGPMQKNVDINLYKKFKWFGFKQTFFIHITNVFNERNVYWVYADTGKPGVDANDATSDDYTRDPTAWGPPRHIRLGLTLNY